MKLQNIFGDYVPFLLNVMAELQRVGIKNERLEIDHICFKPVTLSEYEKNKRDLAQISTLLTETMINGRPIATYKLHDPIIFNGMQIPLFELPAPKPVNGIELRKSLYDHIEIVLRTEDLNAFYKKYPLGKWDLKKIHAQINPDISLIFDHGLVKFHSTSLEEVIAAEISGLHEKNARKAIIFDLDGTLVYTDEAFMATTQDLLNDFFQKEFSRQEIQQNRAPTFDLLFQKFDIPVELHADLVSRLPKYFSKYKDSCYLYEGIETLLSVLKSEGINLCLWTARDRDSVFTTLEQFDLLKYFSFIQYYEMGNKPQPSLSLYKHLEKYEKITLIGDSQSDILAAKALEVPFIHIDNLRDSALVYNFVLNY